jgi:hypothetical protein
MKVHILLTEARKTAQTYTVKPSLNGGFNVWNFRGWDKEQPGWRVISTNHKDRAQAWLYVLDRLNLIPPDDPKPEPIRARIVWSASGDWEPW